MSTSSVILAPAPAPTLQERRAAYWQARERGREAEAVTLWSAYLLWQLVPGNLTLPPSAFLAYMCEGREESPGTLYNTLDRGRALSLGYSGSLTRLAQIGRALRTGIPRAEVDALSPAELAARLRVQRLSDSESAARALTPLRERTRDLLREADPTAPTAPTEADALNLEALELLAERVPALYRAAVQATQTGEVSLLADLAAATRPPTWGEWAKARGRCWVCGRVPEGGGVHDLHHVAYGGHEARTDAAPQVLVPVHRACHIPQPGSLTPTAHSRPLAVGQDAAALARLLAYLAAEHARYEAWIRGETAPQEAPNDQK